MTVVLDGPQDITLEAVRRVAWHGEAVELSARALGEVGRRREAFLAYVAANPTLKLYGITTAHHVGAKQLLSPEARERFARAVPATPASFGPTLPDRVARGVVLARLADLLAGTGPVEPATAQAVAALLAAGPLAPVPERGLGDPGDIIPLSHLLRGPMEAHGLGLGEGMALINGSPVATAALADAVLAGRLRLGLAEEVLALAADAARAPGAHYDPALGRLWGDPHQAAALERLRELQHGGTPERLDHQAAVSFRSAPRLLGWTRRVQAQAEDAASISLAAPSNNPMVLSGDEHPPDGAILSNGGYHDPLAAGTLDALTRAWADLALLAAHQVNRLVEDPDGVRATETEARTTLLYMTAAGWAEEARAAAQPSLLGSLGGGQTDTGTADLLAWRRARDAGAALEGVLATLAVVAAHTTAAAGRAPAPGLAGLTEQVLAAFPLEAAPADYGRGLGALAAAFAARSLDGAIA